MALGPGIATPSSGYTSHIDAVVDATWTLSLTALRELCDVEYTIQTLGNASTDTQIATALANVGTWPGYANDAARIAAVTSYRATLAALRV